MFANQYLCNNSDITTIFRAYISSKILYMTNKDRPCISCGSSPMRRQNVQKFTFVVSICRNVDL